MEVGGTHLIAMEMTQLKDLLVRVRARTRRGGMLVQELSKEEAKLRGHLSATSASLASFLDNLQQVADCARLSEGECKEMGESLANVVDWQKKVQEELAKMLKGWMVKDYTVDNFDEKEKRSKFMCCLGRKSKKNEEEEKEEVMLRVLVKKALEQERLQYQALTLGLKELIQGESALALALSGAVEAEEVLEKASQPKVVTKESSSMIRRTSLSSMASFSYSPGARWSNKSDSEDSGVLSEQGLFGGTTPPARRSDIHQASASRPSSVCQTNSAQKDEEVCYSTVKRSANNEEDRRRSPKDEDVRYSTVRRSPSPCYSPVRSPSPTLLSVQPPMIKDVNPATGTLGREKPATQRPSRPPTQRCGTSPCQVGPWGRSLSNSSLFPQPCSPPSSVEDPGATTVADKRREKRRRNLTQAVSISSLGAEFEERLSQKSSFHSPVPTPESDKLHSVKGSEIDNQSSWEPKTYGESQQAPQKESIRGSGDATWNTPGHVEETRSYPDSPSTLPPPPSFLLDPGQSYHGRNPDQCYGIFEP